MIVEWLLITLLIVGTGFLLFGARTARGLRLLGAPFVLALLAATWVWQARLDRKLESRARLNAPEIGRPGEYAGSDSCRVCHPDQYTSWHRSYHRTMTQLATPETVRGKFDNVTLALNGETYRLERRGTEYWVDMPDPNWTIQEKSSPPKTDAAPAPGSDSSVPPRVQRRITMLTGSHHMQACWVDNQHGNRQYNFPFIYLFEQERWVPRHTAFLRNPDVARWVQIWNVGCINCHSTGGQPRQTEDPGSFNTRVAELGISCEACHGPAARHVALNSDPRRRYSRHLQNKGDDSIVNPARLSPKRSTDVCGRCHSVHAPSDENAWLAGGEGFLPGESLEARMKIIHSFRSPAAQRGSFWSDGMVRVSGREYNGLIKSPCYLKGDLSCLSCHSMHQSSPVNQVAQGMDSNAACLPCHQSIGKNLERHTHHAPGSSGSSCYNCHMPYTSYGLLKALRSHLISKPGVRESLQTGRPNACNLCHLDKSLGWTAQTLSAWYGTPVADLSLEEKTIAASVLWALKGDAGQRALIAWHLGWGPAQETSGRAWMPPYLAASLDDPYPAVRYIASRSLTRLPGYEHFPYDHLAAPDELRRSRERALDIWATAPRPSPNWSLLLDNAGRLRQDELKTLQQLRNNQIIELHE